MSDTVSQLRDLGERWVDADIRGDAGALAALVVPDFALVGPLGFVLDREQWLEQATYQGRPSDGQFRATHIAVLTDDGWRLAGVHLSPIGAFRPPTGD